MPRRVLITGARAAAALDLARDFTVAGWEVHLADCVTVRMARWSRVPARHHFYPSPRLQAQAFRSRIVELVEQLDIDLIVPTCEEVFHLAAPSLAAELGDRLFAPDLGTLRGLHDKLAFARNSRDWGLPVPDSHAIDHTEALARFASTSREWVFKPRFSRFGDRALVGPEVGVLAQVKPTVQAPWMAQRLVRGEEACFQGVAHRGKLVAFAAYCSDWRLGGGARYAFEPLASERHAALRTTIAERMACHAKIHGQFACDVIFDQDGNPQLIECNPRATSGIHLLVGQRDGLAAAMADGTAMADGPPRAAYLAPAMWLFGLPLAIGGRRLRNWRALLGKGRDVISRPGDRAPVIGALADAARFFTAGLRQGISTNAATTIDIEWNGEELD